MPNPNETPPSAAQDSPPSGATALLDRGLQLLLGGNSGDAIGPLTQAAELARQGSNHSLAQFAAACTGVAHIESGNEALGNELLERASAEGRLSSRLRFFNQWLAETRGRGSTDASSPRPFEQTREWQENRDAASRRDTTRYDAGEYSAGQYRADREAASGSTSPARASTRFPSLTTAEPAPAWPPTRLKLGDPESGSRPSTHSSAMSSDPPAARQPQTNFPSLPSRPATRFPGATHPEQSTPHHSQPGPARLLPDSPPGPGRQTTASRQPPATHESGRGPRPRASLPALNGPRRGVVR